MPGLLFALIAAVPSYSAVTKFIHNIQIKADQVWTDTGIELKAGDDLQITATGSLAYSATDKSNPGGWRGTGRTCCECSRLAIAAAGP